MSMAAALGRRSRALEALFEDIARTRMAGLPVLNAALRVEAVGFLCCPSGPAADAEPTACGVLITPWFMNLVRLPLHEDGQPAAVGRSREHAVGDMRFAFLAAFEPGFGAFETCSLFSPMFQFRAHAQARATAEAVLAALRVPAPTAAPPAERAPARRFFLFGRSAAGSPAAGAGQ